MTRAGPRRTVDAASFVPGRLAIARAYKKSARDALALAEEGETAAPILSNIVNAAIAYADCVTAKVASVVNSQEHASAPRLLRAVLKEALPQSQETGFRRILAEKDGAQYGARHLPLSLARSRMEDLERFSTWAEDILG